MRAAEAGNGFAQQHVQLRERVFDIDAHAAAWFESAAKMGMANTMFRLGSCYLRDEGVAANAREALACYKLAAEVNPAQRRLEYNATKAAWAT